MHSYEKNIEKSIFLELLKTDVSYLCTDILLIKNLVKYPCQGQWMTFVLRSNELTLSNDFSSEVLVPVVTSFHI